MAKISNSIQIVKQRIKDEIGSKFFHSPKRVAMLYPSPYSAGMSSLGYQWTIEILANAGFSVERVFLPDNIEQWKKDCGTLVSYETQTPLSHFPVIGVSLAYELELSGLIECLRLAGIPTKTSERSHKDPRIILGGPITFSNPLPTSAFVDAILLGEVEETIVSAFELAVEENYDSFLDGVMKLEGGFVPAKQYPILPPIAKASDALLPARSHILTPHTELANMFLIEGERGCHRSCTFCVMRRSTNGGMRLVTPEGILSFVPEHAKKVGLVGAAISDHPQLVPLLEKIIESNREIGISSLRADRIALKPDIARLLRLGGYKTLTVASDAASQKLRRDISKGTIEKHLFACAELAKEYQYKLLKIYMMVGVPHETNEDLDELIKFATEISKIHPIVFGIAPFVPKKNTPLDTANFAGIKVVDQRLEYLQKGLRQTKGRAQIRSTSAKWAWVEYMLAQGGMEAGLAVEQSVLDGGNFAAWKRNLEAIDPTQQSPWRHTLENKTIL